MSSAYSITRAVSPPRAVFLDFPLGHTAGKPGETALNRRIMLDTLAAFAAIDAPGTIVTLPYTWADDDAWKKRVMTAGAETAGPRDERIERTETPQYQLEDDAAAAAEAGGCATCVWLERA
jgi:hypothetical protein